MNSLTPPLDLDKFSSDVGGWHRRMFPDATDQDVLCKLTEEVGELCSANQKQRWATDQQGRDEGWLKEGDAIGDIMVVLAAYCARRRIDFNYNTFFTWVQVRQRSTERVRTGKDPARDGDSAGTRLMREMEATDANQH